MPGEWQTPPVYHDPMSKGFPMPHSLSRAQMSMTLTFELHLGIGKHPQNDQIQPQDASSPAIIRMGMVVTQISSIERPGWVMGNLLDK